MVSTIKRVKYVFDNDVSSSEEDSFEDTDYNPRENNNIEHNDSIRNQSERITRKPKCYSKNALIARENRLKKKMYISQLENDVTTLKIQNKKLLKAFENQSCVVTDLKKEVKYLKSVIRNSGDISKLIRNIHQNTGMSVSSSLDENLSLNRVSLPSLIGQPVTSSWNVESNYLSSPDYNVNNDFSGNLFNDVSLNIQNNTTPIELFNDCLMHEENKDVTSNLEEHNYVKNLDGGLEDDAGVCLHVSKHRVSLEFCADCSDKASRSWKA